ncbi:hypothetical protein [Chitinophaga qingshengii]|uniref:Uncharacterized protein n=1 Tax=Chitinophaga qingshengii TaxID=1569794 RepID=A0ABR7TNZ1_9BACT|nr:hypothetical protein [Chitinophaga qingshengii]MBC9931713.1 hypothetical protein [Chitinophaga qingshengii]
MSKRHLNKEKSTGFSQNKKKPAPVLTTDKGTVTRNPLHGDLSASPEKENKAVRDSEKKKKNQDRQT